MPTIYAPLRDRLLVVAGEDDPTATERLADRDLECVAASPAAPERVFAGTFESGLLRSADGGDTWERVGTETIEPDAVTSATVSPHDPDEVWVGTEPSRIYRSTDSGDAWERRPGITDLPSESEWYFPPRPHTHHVRWIEVDPNEPERLYVGIEAGALVVSEDAGETWRERPPGSRRDNHSLATHPDAPGRVWSAAGDGYAESRDGGETWEHPQEGLDHRYCWSVAPDPGDPGTVLISSATGARTAHRTDSAESYVYRKTDGSEWERLDGRGLPAGEGVVRAVIATGDEPGTFYAVNNRGPFRTDDAGDDWDRLDVEWPEAYATQAPRGLAVV